MKKWLAIALVMALSVALAACGKADDSGLSGRRYVYENEGFGGGEFAITVSADGSFTYSEGMFSSYVGTGEWTIEEDLVVLTDEDYMDFGLENYFLR